jgi:hypothetical protein
MRDTLSRLPVGEDVVDRRRVSWLVEHAAALALTVGLHPIVGAGAAPAPQKPGQPETLDTVIERAAAAVASFEREFAAVVAEERYIQRTGARIRIDQREVRSDLLLVRVSGQDGWVPFRDVYEVNGRRVRDRDERLQKLFSEAPESALTTAAQISNESSRYNIGSVIRSINVPTFGLMLLRPSYLKRFDFRKLGEDRIAGVTTWRVGFVERSRPAVVRTLRGDDVMLEGSLWIDPLSGRVLKTLVKTVGTPDPGLPAPSSTSMTRMWVEVTFSPSDTPGLWVPETMTEWARAANFEVVSGTATYSKFRRFAVKTTETFETPENR